MFCQSAVEHISGHAEFTEDGGVMVAGKKYSGTHTLIATGGRPTEPGIPGEEFKYNLFIVCTYFILTEKTPPGTYPKYMYMYMAIMTKLSTPLHVKQYWFGENVYLYFMSSFEIWMEQDIKSYSRKSSTYRINIY